MTSADRIAIAVFCLLSAVLAPVARGASSSCLQFECPDGFVPRQDVAQRSCQSEVCTRESDLDTCCNQFCFGSHPCPHGHVAKANASALVCDGVCDLGGADADICCDEVCSSFECSFSDHSRPKVNASMIRCDGPCHPVHDRAKCCDFAAAINMSGQLLRAVVNSETKMVTKLVKMGAMAPSSVAAEHHLAHRGALTALHLAALQGNAEVILSLATLEGVDVNSRDELGWTPLQTAAGRGKTEAVEALLKIGGNPLLRTFEGQLARELLLLSSPLSARYPRDLEAILANAERRWTDDVPAAHIDSKLLQALPVQRGISAWLLADEDTGTSASGSALLDWVDRSGFGASAAAAEDSNTSEDAAALHPPPRVGAVGSRINERPAVLFAPGAALQAVKSISCKTVALVVQHTRLSYQSNVLLSLVGGDVLLRVSDPVRGYKREGPGTRRALERRDWQYRQEHKLWINGDSQAMKWHGFPDAAVVVIAVRHPGRGEDVELRYTLGGHNGFEGLLGEVIMYNRELSDQEVQELNGYLMQSWGIVAEPASDEL